MGDKTSVVRYIRNPDMVLREEDQDGALLFNPDTNQVKVINNTGLFIWNLCDGNHEIASMAAALKEAFANVPDDKVDVQIQAFMNEMSDSGFIGVLE